jgi:N-acetylneuraminate synthase
MTITIDGRRIGPEHPTYFIADIAANHDGSLDRARALIGLAKKAGADAAKFQHFVATEIVSGAGFSRLGAQVGHQAAWTKPVEEVYADASVPADWTVELKAECDRVGITFLSTPYDLETIDALDPFLPAYKVGSGDIDWLEALERIASKGKPVLLGTGASTLEDVGRAVEVITRSNPDLVLLQCNTNYTGSDHNFDHLHLRVLQKYAEDWPDLVLGLSDHTHGPAAVLGAVTLGARVIERHFTDDNARPGPDHAFALDPPAWRAMVTETRRLERALGDPDKRVAGNEDETVVVQRRCLRAARDLSSGQELTREDLSVLRPATPGALRPSDLHAVLGRHLAVPVAAGEELTWSQLAG